MAGRLILGRESDAPRSIKPRALPPGHGKCDGCDLRRSGTRRVLLRVAGVHDFLTFIPAAANVQESSYTEALRQRDASWGYGWYNRGKPGMRLIHDTVQFENNVGDRRTASVSRWVSRRYPPYDSYVVWYDTRSDRVTANGPSYWLCFAAVLVAIFGGIAVLDAQIISHH